ncbi:MAG: TOBE domain-containing protein, partial [Holophaga sp.]|nr:TOBE domain-containing protein [Holophaga sp.]
MRLASTLLASSAALAACTFLACHRSQDEKPAVTAAASANSIQGTVLEVLPAPPYSYLRVKAAQGELWAAVPAAQVKVGDPVTVLVQVRMDKFQSSTLQRTFDAVYMGTLAGAAPVAGASAPAPPAPAAPATMPPT